MPNAIKLLLIEDCASDAKLITEVFRTENIDVGITVARDGAEAISYLQKLVSEAARIPDLIILDLNTPIKNGKEVLQELKADMNLKIIPIIVLTTSDADSDIADCYKLQASCYIRKPTEASQFVKMARSIDAFWFASARFPGSQV